MKVLMCWSGGKDSAMALRVARDRADLEVAGLLTTFSEEFDRVSMHGVRRELLEAQAQALGLPVWKVFLPTPPKGAACALPPPARRQGFVAFASNDVYEEKMIEALERARREGIEAIVFGDIFLEDLRAYRERLLAGVGLKGVYPLWGRPTRELMEEFIARGFRAVVVCVDAARLDASWAGRPLDARFLAELPEGVDPCGENGEYHTFVFDGPGFSRPVALSHGATVARDSFCFRELERAAPGATA
jgi:uncharacterized protein (TIGR00290 family)